MNSIKSVRVRKNYHSSLDLKVTLYEEDHFLSSDEVILIGLDNNNNTVWLSTRYKKKGLFKNFTNDDFIKNYIELNSKIEGGTSVYEIIQDPWTPNAPKFRNYGRDVYYLNNGSTIKISWADDTKSVGGVLYSDSNGIELNSPPELTQAQYTEKKKFIKTVYINTNTPIENNEYDFVFSIDKEFEYITSNKSKYPFYYNGYVLDKTIIQEVLTKWNNSIPNYNVELCTPDNESCSVIEYKSPLKPIEPEKVVNKFATNEQPKEKINFIVPSTIKTKSDINFKLYIGKVLEIIDDVNDNSIDDYYGISDEYTEANFEGMDEQELEVQESVSNSQEDSDSNLGQVGEAANIRPVSSLDGLLRLAGDCARELGKNRRIRYENLKSGYIKGVHGLCPQGTLSVLYALTGVKKIGQLNGNANSFSFNGINSFSSTGYFEKRIKIDDSYFNNNNLWQIGDVVAVDYTGGKKYGHIQVWTGICWMSDFKQNTLQRSHVDWDSVALWRLNSKGIIAAKKQAGYSV